MRGKRYATYFLLLYAFFLLEGCAVPKRMSSEDISRIKSLAVATSLENDDFNIIDLSRIRKKEYSKTYGGMMHGAIGGALEALIIEGMAKYKINSSVDGDIAPIKQSIPGFDAKNTFEEIFFKGFSENVRINKNIQKVDIIKLDESAFNNGPSSAYDTLLKIEFKYGIGAYQKDKPLTAMDAKVSVISLQENKRMMTDFVTSYGCSENNYTLEDYAKDNGKIYKQCFNEMADYFSKKLANQYFY